MAKIPKRIPKWGTHSGEDEDGAYEYDLVPSADVLCNGGCGRSLPRSEFHADVNNANGLKSACKKCRSIQHKEERNREIVKQIRKLDRATLRAIELMSKGGSRVPHTAEVFEKIMSLMGGSGGYAQHYVSTYLTAEPGSLVRQKMLQSVMMLGKHVSETGVAEIPLDLMSTPDLEALHQEQLKRLLDKSDVIEADGKVVPEAEHNTGGSAD